MKKTKLLQQLCENQQLPFLDIISGNTPAMNFNVVLDKETENTIYKAAAGIAVGVAVASAIGKRL